MLIYHFPPSQAGISAPNQSLLNSSVNWVSPFERLSQSQTTRAEESVVARRGRLTPGHRTNSTVRASRTYAYANGHIWARMRRRPKITPCSRALPKRPAVYIQPEEERSSSHQCRGHHMVSSLDMQDAASACSISRHSKNLRLEPLTQTSKERHGASETRQVSWSTPSDA